MTWGVVSFFATDPPIFVTVTNKTTMRRDASEYTRPENTSNTQFNHVDSESEVKFGIGQLFIP